MPPNGPSGQPRRDWRWLLTSYRVAPPSMLISSITRTSFSFQAHFLTSGNDKNCFTKVVSWKSGGHPGRRRNGLSSRRSGRPHCLTCRSSEEGVIDLSLRKSPLRHRQSSTFPYHPVCRYTRDTSRPSPDWQYTCLRSCTQVREPYSADS